MKKIVVALVLLFGCLASAQELSKDAVIEIGVIGDAKNFRIRTYFGPDVQNPAQDITWERLSGNRVAFIVVPTQEYMVSKEGFKLGKIKLSPKDPLFSTYGSTFSNYNEFEQWAEDSLGESDGDGSPGNGATSFAELDGQILDSQITESAAKIYEGSLEIDASQVSNLPSGTGSGDLETITDSDFNNLSTQDSTDYIGFITQSFENKELFTANDASSVDDANNVGSWTVDGGATLSVETTLTNGSDYAIRMDQVGSGTGKQLIRTTISGLKESTEYIFKADKRHSGWQQNCITLRTDGSGDYNPAYQICNAGSEAGQWNSGSITFSTGIGETSIEVLVISATDGQSGHYYIVDNMSIKETAVDVYYPNTVKSYKNENGITPINLPAKYTFYDNSQTEISESNLQDAIDELDGRTQVYDYMLSVDENQIIRAASTSRDYTSYISGDLSVIMASIQRDRIDPFKSYNGRVGVSLHFKNGDYYYYSTITMSGPYPNNTEATIIEFTMVGEGSGTNIRHMAWQSETDGLVFTDGLRIRLENFALTTTQGNSTLLRLKAPSTTSGFSVKDSYINNIDVRADTDYAEAESAVIFENFFGLTVPKMLIYNYGGSGLILRNNSSTTNYGNSIFGKITIATSGGDDTTGLILDTAIDTKHINLLTFNYIDLGSLAGEGAGSNATGIHFNNTQNITVDILVSEYLGKNMLIEDSANITISNSLFTIDKGSSQANNEAYGIKLDNSQNVKILNGIYYTSDYTARPVIVDNVSGKSGNYISGYLTNGFGVDNIEYNTPNYAELHFQEDGTTNRLDIYPDNLQIRGKTIGTTGNRPSSPNTGDEHFDTTLSKMIVYNGTDWINVDGTSL